MRKFGVYNTQVWSLLAREIRSFLFFAFLIPPFSNLCTYSTLQVCVVVVFFAYFTFFLYYFSFLFLLFTSPLFPLGNRRESTAMRFNSNWFMNGTLPTRTFGSLASYFTNLHCNCRWSIENYWRFLCIYVTFFVKVWFIQFFLIISNVITINIL